MAGLEISVVVPTHGPTHARSPLESCIASVLSQDLDPDRFELIVVPNLSTDSVITRLEGLRKENANFRIAIGGRVGANRARNQGASLSRGKIVFFLDDDAFLPDPTYLTKLAAKFARERKTSIAGGAYLDPPGASSAVRGYHLMTRMWIRAGLEKDGSARNLVGGCLAVRRSIWDEGFRFNEEIVVQGDDTEFLRRLRSAGARIVFDEGLSVFHAAASSWSSARKRAWAQGRASTKYSLATSLTADRGETLRRALLDLRNERAWKDVGSLSFLPFHFGWMLAGRALSTPRSRRPRKTDESPRKAP